MRVSSTAGDIGQRLARSAHRQLDEAPDERRDDRQHQGDDEQDRGRSAAAPVAVAPAPSPATPEGEAQEPVGQQRDAADQHADQQREADVVVADVAHLVGHHALQLLAVHLLEQPGGDGHRGVLRVASGGEGVRGGVVDDVDLRHRQAAGEAHLGHHVEELLVLVRRIAAAAPPSRRSRARTSLSPAK